MKSHNKKEITISERVYVCCVRERKQTNPYLYTTETETALLREIKKY